MKILERISSIFKTNGCKPVSFELTGQPFDEDELTGNEKFVINIIKQGRLEHLWEIQLKFGPVIEGLKEKGIIKR